MNKYQEYLNDEYRKNFEDANLLTDEEVALMNPKEALDEEGYWYQHNMSRVVDAKRKVDLLVQYIWYHKQLLNNPELTYSEREKMNSKIGYLVQELNKAKRELNNARYQSDELNTLFNRR